MRKIRIFDNSFMGHSRSASLREENKDVTPTYFEWTDEGPLTKPTFFTDGAIKDAPKYGSAPGKIAWLLEPRCLRPENYEAAKENQAFFDVILTYDIEFLEEIPQNGRFFCLGGSSISFDKWNIYPKSKNICAFISDKDTTEGHKLRRVIANFYSDKIDFYGAGVGKPVESKFEVLKDYQYEVVIESCFIDGYFTEKLIDPISVGTIPIYRGSRFISALKDYGDLQFHNIEKFHDVMRWMILWHDYYKLDLVESWIKSNLKNSHELRIVEDYLFKFYPELFA